MLISRTLRAVNRVDFLSFEKLSILKLSTKHRRKTNMFCTHACASGRPRPPTCVPVRLKNASSCLTGKEYFTGVRPFQRKFKYEVEGPKFEPRR